MNIRCFIDKSGHLWSINGNGESNYPGKLAIDGNKVRVIGAKDDLEPGDEYTLWPSMTALAIAIEHDASECSSDDGVSLQQAISDTLKGILSFETDWIKSNQVNPDHFPLTLPNDNSGLWYEMIFEHLMND